MKLTDMAVSAILKRGILYEARNVEIEVPITNNKDGHEEKITVHFKAEHMTLRVDKEES